MSNIHTSLLLTAMFICAPGLAVSSERPLAIAQESFPVSTTVSPRLSLPQQALLPIAALAAMGDLPRLATALERGLDAGLTISEIREILVQLYAYAGFPRSLNALGQFMKVLETRRQRGVVDEPGKAPSQPIPRGEALLQAGTANQRRLIGAPVTGELFEFAPAIDEYLKTHLFGDIFSRDNLDWPSRELATVSMLAALSGTDPQLQAHLKISRNVGLTTNQLQQLATILSDQVDMQTGARVSKALAALPTP